jgi:hypothetical protein
MHAVLGALGANFRNSKDLFKRASRTGGTISYSYSLAVPRVGILALPGSAWLIGSLKGSPPAALSDASHRQGHVYFTAHFPNPVDQIPVVLLARTGLISARPADRVGSVLCRSTLGAQARRSTESSLQVRPFATARARGPDWSQKAKFQHEQRAAPFCLKSGHRFYDYRL